MSPARHDANDQYAPSNSPSLRVHDIEARGKRWEVHLSNSGSFTAEVHGKTLNGGTRDDLRDKIMKATKRARVTVEVPFSILKARSRYGDRRWEVKNGVAVGLHQGHGAVLVKYDDGKAEQFGNTYRTDQTTLVPLSDDEAEDWVRLTDEREKAFAALRDFESKHGIDLRKVVEQAVQEKVGDGS